MKKRVVALLVLLSATFVAKGDLHLFVIENSDAKTTPEVIEKAFVANGFKVAVNSEMNYPYKKQFNQTDFTIFNLLTIYHAQLSQKLVKKYPQMGVFTPFGIGIYQKIGEKKLHLSLLSAAAIEKIAGVRDPLIGELVATTLRVIQKRFPHAKESMSQNSLKEANGLVTKYEMKLDGADFASAKEELEMRLENGFEPYGFVMPNYMDYNAQLLESGDSPYDIFATYSICKLKVIYTVSKSRPEAAAFAPCTLMVYKKKDEDKIVLGFPAVYNWLSSARVEDAAAKEVLMQAQKDFETILQEATE